MPSIPSLTPNVNLNRDDALNVILASIGIEELSLAHLVNAEAEKIQFVLGTLEPSEGLPSQTLLSKDATSGSSLRKVIKALKLSGTGLSNSEALSLNVLP